MGLGPDARTAAWRGPVIRWSAGRKAEAVLRILSGEPVRALSEELGLDVERLNRWRDEFVRAGKDALKSRRPDRDPAERALRRAEQKIGQLTLENEALRGSGERARPKPGGPAGRGGGARSRPTAGIRPAAPEGG